MNNRIQNDLVSSFHSLMMKKFQSNFENSFILLMSYGTSDVGHCDQLFVVVHYFNEEINRPTETFIALKKKKKMTKAQSIFSILNIVFEMINKEWSSILAVYFDGASSTV